MSEEEAIQKLRKDPLSRAAWEVLYLQLYPRLLVYVSRLLVDFGLKGEEAADIVQSVMLSFFKQWDKIRLGIPDATGAFRYLKTSARNLLITQLRAGRRAEALCQFLTLRVSSGPATERELLRAVFLRQILAKLPPQCATLLKQYIEKDLSPAEMADEENTSPKTFYSRWYRCLQKAAELARTANDGPQLPSG